MAVPATTCGAPGRLSGSGLPSFSPLWGFAGSLEASILHFGTVSLYARIFALHCPTPYSAVLSENSPVAIVQLTLVAHLSVCDPFQECMSVQISVLCGCLPGLQGGGRPTWGHSKHVLCTSSRCAARSKPMHPVNSCGGYGKLSCTCTIGREREHSSAQVHTRKLRGAISLSGTGEECTTTQNKRSGLR